jgi:diguanylate cyclase (GGDEF)-like protein
LEAELSFSEQHRRSIAVLLIDIDLFKQINDRHGHPFADGVLKVVALTIQRMLRTEDVLARYGGDEFIVLARPMSHHNALILAQRIRKAIAALALSDGAGSVPVTVSIGIATSRTRETTEQCLTAAADRALYRSKRGGRDQIHVEPADELCAEQARALG